MKVFTDAELEAHDAQVAAGAAYAMDAVGLALVAKAREAIAALDNGAPAKCVIDEDEIFDALRLLVGIVDSGCAF